MSPPSDGLLPAGSRPSRREIAAAVAMTLLRLVISAVVIVLMLELIPESPDGRILLPSVVGIVAVVLYIWFFRRQLRGIYGAKFPSLRAGEALILVAAMFLAMFAMVYVLISERDPASFTEPLDAFTSYYFALTVLATVGFGDITPVDTLARSLTMVQMALDLVFIAVVIRVIGAVTKKALGNRNQDREGAGADG